jgi:hypothetical protein
MEQFLETAAKAPLASSFRRSIRHLAVFLWALQLLCQAADFRNDALEMCGVSFTE